jgi:hypothetical protein
LPAALLAQIEATLLSAYGQPLTALDVLRGATGPAGVPLPRFVRVSATMLEAELLLALGEPAGVVQLLDRHNRDCASLAARLGVPHHRVPDTLTGSPFEVVTVLRWRRWREDALWWPERRILVTADAIGTNRFFAGKDPAGVHPLLRLTPPRLLGRYAPLHLLVGHGEGIHGDDADRALQRALATARTGIPRWLAGLV